MATTSREAAPSPAAWAAPDGNGNGNGWKAGTGPVLAEALSTYRDLVIGEIRRIIAAKRFRRALSQRLADYPLRAGKGLRPALCLATCQAHGGSLGEALPSATALELFHNAFLVHDDIEDESIHRRGDPTMHEKHGVAIAINVGDALNVLTMTPLLDNLEVVGLEKALRVFREIERMGRESVEGQAMELEWVKNCHWDLTERDYHVMTTKKTCWYTCITPCRIGALIGGGPSVDLDAYTRFGRDLGIAFQIQDDLLNLVGEEDRYGKEQAGDIREGKRTLLLIDLLRRCTAGERRRVVATLSKPRDGKTDDEVEDVLALMHRHGCLDHGRRRSLEYARKAKAVFGRDLRHVPASAHKQFLEETIDYVIHRDL
ncbi:MAG TPA: polyprenyl synthetase family protein [Acidimicrobiales bacterium]|nr:polyprenyl synthetase family protein [Acidimicrobiales bacterium]